jgi:hypothetical protein
MTDADLSLADIDCETGGRLGVMNIACPLCGPSRRAEANRRRPVMRVWRLDPSYATFHCCRCGESGSARDGSGARRPIDARALARARAEADERERAGAAERLNKARWLWQRRHPVAGTAAERYLRDARRISLDRWPATLGFLPASDRYPPAMIAAFGLAREIEPGVIAIADDAISGVHLTRLLPDGSDRERDDRAKIMIGKSAGWPIVLAPPNDLLGMAITEGIEDALSVHAASGLGAWAAGAASRLPALAGAVPSYIDCVTILVDDNDTGRDNSSKFAERITRRGIEAILVNAAMMRGAL